MTLAQRAGAEALGTAFLLAAVVGSGIMGERLSGGNVAVALLANALATGGALVALIAAAGPVSGAHFNPVVSLMLAARGELGWKDFPAYAAAQSLGALVGVIAAHAMFGLPWIEFSQKTRAGPAQMFSEFVATLGLLLLIASLSRHRREAAPWAVAAYIVGAYWFTASTSFANPAITLARCLTDSFAGIRPQDVAGFVLAQFAACIATILLLRRARA